MKSIRNAPCDELTLQFRNTDAKTKLYVLHMTVILNCAYTTHTTSLQHPCSQTETSTHHTARLEQVSFEYTIY